MGSVERVPVRRKDACKGTSVAEKVGGAGLQKDKAGDLYSTFLYLIVLLY